MSGATFSGGSRWAPGGTNTPLNITEGCGAPVGASDELVATGLMGGPPWHAVNARHNSAGANLPAIIEA
jgi:hypothetical protein